LKYKNRSSNGIQCRVGPFNFPAAVRQENVEFGGKIPDINVNFNNAPPNMTAQQIDEWKKMFQSVVNEQYFRNYLIKVTEPSGTEMATY
jgi:hypothetical protein